MADATCSLLWDLGSQTRHGSEKSCWSKSLDGLGTSGRLGLEGFLLTLCIPTDCLVDRLPLGGRRRGFTLRTSISSLITHLCVVFVFASFFPTLLPFILLLCYYEYGLEQLVCLYARIYSFLHLVKVRVKSIKSVTCPLDVQNYPLHVNRRDPIFNDLWSRGYHSFRNWVPNFEDKFFQSEQ